MAWGDIVGPICQAVMTMPSVLLAGLGFYSLPLGGSCFIAGPAMCVGRHWHCDHNYSNGQKVLAYTINTTLITPISYTSTHTIHWSHSSTLSHVCHIPMQYHNASSWPGQNHGTMEYLTCSPLTGTVTHNVFSALLSMLLLKYKYAMYHVSSILASLPMIHSPNCYHIGLSPQRYNAHS